MSTRNESKRLFSLDARLMVAALALTMSTTVTSGESAEPRHVRLVVTDTGQYILSGKPVALANLRVQLRELKSSGRPIDLHVTGSSKVEYKYVLPAMQIAQEEGLAKAAVVMSPPSAPGSSASPSSK
ncbi:biopolymer transporter ExbD [Pelomonas sp. Root1237]|uniref:ExbD/TolR family protein n=1 Tax=Pelomonas sp. Root1237 TaxID=1736434 RepID=UPI0009E85374